MVIVCESPARYPETKFVCHGDSRILLFLMDEDNLFLNKCLVLPLEHNGSFTF